MKLRAMIMFGLIGLSFINGAYAQDSFDFDTQDLDVQSQNVSDIQQAPSCICSGGPGNYQYQCPAKQATCIGGPGYYAYTCWVCPQ